MHGVTDRSFRRLTSELSNGRTSLHVSEFVAVEALASGAKKEMDMMMPHTSESSFCVQIFGVDIEAMRLAAIAAQDNGVQFVELNVGCPAPKVVKRGGGSGLLRDLPHLRAIVSTLRTVVDVPLSVKVRVGWSEEEITLRESHRIAEDEGADLFIIHGRTRLQGYRGWADWDMIGEVASRSKIPVIGNGDILQYQDVVNKLTHYGVDGVSIGRGALHNPWIFGQYADYIEGKRVFEPKSMDVLKAFDLFHQFMVEDGFIEKRYMGRLKQLAARIFKVVAGSQEHRAILLRKNTWESFYGGLRDWEASLSDDQRERKILDFNELGNLNGKPDRTVHSGDDYNK